MKSELKAKFLQHLISKKRDGGFTLIELLVVIIIIGILAAIALPSFLNQANKAKQSEAKTYVGSMNRAQQAYYLEKNAFVSATGAIGDLGLGIAATTANYKYVIASTNIAGSTNQAQQVQGVASPLKAYLGGVTVGTIAATSEATTLSVLCEADKAAIINNALLGNVEVDYTKIGSATDLTRGCTTNYSPLK
jgi:type IV pilus assembly protein PilA